MLRVPFGVTLLLVQAEGGMAILCILLVKIDHARMSVAEVSDLYFEMGSSMR